MQVTQRRTLLENLGDTVDRVQANIGTQLLPVVKDITTAAGNFLSKLETASPAVTKTIAVLGVLATTFVTVTAGAAGLAAALPAITAALAFLVANPIGLAITAIAALTAGVIAWRVATSDTTSAVEGLQESLNNQDYSQVITRADAVRERIAAIGQEIDALESAPLPGDDPDEPGDIQGGLFEFLTRAAARERAQLLNERTEAEAALAEADEAVLQDLSTITRQQTGEDATRDAILRPTDEAGQAPEQRATFSLNVEGAVSEADVANINSAVESLSLIGENTEVPQVLKDLNAELDETAVVVKKTSFEASEL